MKDIFISMEIYLIASVVAILIAGLIKGMLGVIRRFSPKETIMDEEK